jgi:hypothetical protein
LRSLPRLTAISASQLNGDGARLDLSGLTQLEQLIIQLDRGTLDDQSIASLKDLRGLRNLQLPSTTVSDAGLAHLSGLTSLDILIIGGPAVSDRGLTHLASLSSLRDLTLTGRISDRGLVSLEKLERMQRLTLRSSQAITPGAIQRLRQAVPTPIEVMTERL